MLLPNRKRSRSFVPLPLVMRASMSRANFSANELFRWYAIVGEHLSARSSEASPSPIRVKRGWSHRGGSMFMHEERLRVKRSELRG